MEELLRQILNRLDGMDKRFDKIDARLDKIELRLDKIETRLDQMDARLDNLEGQIAENSGLIEALLHRTEELDAKYDGLLQNTATRESITRLEAKFDVLNQRLFEQETDLYLLKKQA